MRFSVVYEADCRMDDSIRRYAPPKSRAWFLTEQADGKPSNWCSELWGGKAKHRKWCGLLTRTQFDEFLRATGLFAEMTETMGSLGAPGFGYGLSPAISFRDDASEAIKEAYVTPILDVIPRRLVSEKRSNVAWHRVRRAVLAVYG